MLFLLPLPDKDKPSSFNTVELIYIENFSVHIYIQSRTSLAGHSNFLVADFMKKRAGSEKH